MTLSQRFAEAVPDHVREGRVLAAVSGGADSTAMALLLVLALGKRRVVIAHLDHGLRKGSREDARWVAALAKRLGVRSVVARRKVTKRRGESPEAAARRVRYGFLDAAAKKARCGIVATAHHMDDQAETVLYRIATGTGIEGLQGVRPWLNEPGRSTVWRPLLGFRREELRAWLRERGQIWREDPTNADGNVRSRLRASVLPALSEAVRRDVAPLLARLADNAQNPGRERPARAAPRPRKPRAAKLPRVESGVRSAANAVFLERLRARPGAAEILDADHVALPVRVRRPRKGDRFHQLGAPGTKPQRLTHYLQRRDVPAEERRLVPLVVDAEGAIVWVVGHGIAKRAAVTAATRSVLLLRVV